MRTMERREGTRRGESRLGWKRAMVDDFLLLYSILSRDKPREKRWGVPEGDVAVKRSLKD